MREVLVLLRVVKRGGGSGNKHVWDGRNANLPDGPASGLAGPPLDIRGDNGSNVERNGSSGARLAMEALVGGLERLVQVSSPSPHAVPG